MQEKRIVEPRNGGINLLDLDGVRPSVAEVVEVLERECLAVLDRAPEARVADIDAMMLPVRIGDAVLDPAEAELVEMAVGLAQDDLEHDMQAAEPHGDRNLEPTRDLGLNLIERDLEARDGGHAATGKSARSAFQCQGSSS